MAMPQKPSERMPRLLRGSLVTLRRRCGKPSCRCADGEQLHETPALDVPAVAAALDRYRAAQAELQAQAKAGLAALADRIGADRAAGRRPRRGR
jgi:hypothetical protein